MKERLTKINLFRTKVYALLKNDNFIKTTHFSNSLRTIKTKRITMVKERYKCKDKNHDRNKLLCNKIFSRLAKRNKGKCLILDAESLQTTKSLHKDGFKYSDIVIPNPFVYDKLLKKIPKGVWLYNMFLGDFINSYDEFTHSFNNAWFDYCGVFEGSKECNPKDDIDNYFKKHLPAEYGTFAVTFKTGRDKKSYLYQDIIEADCYIQEIAYSYGYTLIKANQRFYKGMCFIIYKVVPKYLE